jgi:peroxiredoxin
MARTARRPPASAGRLHRPVSELLSAGAPAPDFTAAASDGRTYRLGQLLAQARVLLVFYPGNDTPG